jgi:protein-S-isoprenylcysteine O-methyltransferase Ste14
MIFIIANLIIGLCVTILAISIILNFLEVNRNNITRSKKSIVATGTMSLFAICFYGLLRFRVGELPLHETIQNIAIFIGTGFVILGCAVNVLGRKYLGTNWSNHINIFENQSLVITGPFKVVRHPLYFSIILMLFGSAVVYSNLAAILATSVVFIPFMYYRASQEEKILSAVFKDYVHYQKTTGMLFPKYKSLKELFIGKSIG